MLNTLLSNLLITLEDILEKCAQYIILGILERCGYRHGLYIGLFVNVVLYTRNESYILLYLQGIPRFICNRDELHTRTEDE